jgi:hypothetical protein
MSRNKICRRQLATRFGANNEKKLHPRKGEIFFIKLVVTSMATMKKIILCVLLAFFFSISLMIHLHSCRDYGIRTPCVATTGGVPDFFLGLVHAHPSIMTVAAKEKRHNLPFRRDSGSNPHIFAADLRYQFAQYIMTSIVHF